MSNIASIASRTTPVARVTQLPVHWYCDERIFALEQQYLFQASAAYVGHALMVPEEQDYRTLEWLDHSKMLIRAEGAAWQMSNICRHRQAIMLEGQGKAAHIVCPIHRWTYNTGGQLIGAPRFAQNPCLHLNRQRLEDCHGLLFSGPRSAQNDLSGLDFARHFDFSGYQLDRVVSHDCNYNWKTFVEVYLEDYHVAPYHPGLGKMVSCDELSWQFGAWYSLQKVGRKPNPVPFAEAGSAAYARWQNAIRAYGLPEQAEQGAVWLTYYPNVMVEWYPHVLVVSSLIPLATNKTRNVVEFYYPEDICLFERELIVAQQAAYMETALEDDNIGERMDRGRRALQQQGRNEVGPYQLPMEEGMRHFHEFYRRIMAPHLELKEQAK